MTSITEAAEAGDSRALLVAMRARVAKAVQDPDTPPRDLAALTRRLMEINREIESVDAAESEDDLGRALTVPDEEFDPASI